MTPVLETRQLVRRFGKLTAVDQLDIRIPQGCCFGLLGPNGAGKTTTIEMMEGISQPDAGEILYRGEPLGPAFHQVAGIQFQQTALQDFLTVRNTLTLFSKLYHQTMSIDELIELCALQEFLDRDTRKLSGGQRQRLLLAIALINDPDIVFLDEPTTGLDPQARRNFWRLIETIRARGKTILLTTHYMDEAQVLCDEIAIMDHGRIIAEGSPETLLGEHFNETIIELSAEANEEIVRNQGLEYIRRGNTLEIHAPELERTIQALLAASAELSSLKVRQWNLEDLFIKLTGNELRV